MRSILLIAGLCYSLPAMAQLHAGQLQVSYQRNTYLLIQGTTPDYINFGGDSGQIISQQNTTGQGVVVTLSATREGIPGTNMLVACRDTFWMFSVVYKELPDQELYRLSYTGHGGQQRVSTKKERLNDEGLSSLSVDSIRARQLLHLAKNVSLSAAANRVVLMLDVIAVDSAFTFFKFRVRNLSNNTFRPDVISFLVQSQRGRQRLSQTTLATQEYYPAFLPLPDNPKVIEAKSEGTLCYAVKLSALSHDEALLLLLKEKADVSKGRGLSMQIPSSILENPRVVML